MHCLSLSGFLCACAEKWLGQQPTATQLGQISLLDVLHIVSGTRNQLCNIRKGYCFAEGFLWLLPQK